MIRRTGLVLATLLGSLIASSAFAQSERWEVSGLVGVTPSVDLDHRARELDDLAIRGDVTWGVQAGWLFTPRWGVEALWMHQPSALELGDATGTVDLFKLAVDQVQGNVLFHFGRADARLRPFALAGAGATIFTADDLPSETKLSFGFGGGIKVLPWRSVGVRAHVRYKPIMLNDEDALPFCDPFGFCQNWLQQVEYVAGLIVRFE